MPLPHFTKLQSTNTNFEAVHASLFEVTFVLPQILQTQGRDALMLLENATNVTFDTTNKEAAPQTQRFKYSTRVYMTMPADTHIDFSIKFNVNMDDNGSVFVWNTLKAWYDLVWNSQDGSLHYKRDIIGTVVANQHDKKGFIIRRVTFHNVQLKTIGSIDLDWESNQSIIGPLDVAFVADYWTDEYIDNGFTFNPPKLF